MRIVTPLLFLLLCSPLRSQDFEFYPGAVYDPAVPTLKEIVGHGWGEKITMHHEVESYLKALAEASPKVRLETHGRTWEGKTLYHLVIASEANQARIGEIQAGMSRLADPRGLASADADSQIQSLPSIVWLSYSVHGNEISSTDAGLLTAYHLAAVRNDEVAETILAHSVVIVDPLQNPDGRDRFIQYFRQTRGRWADSDPQAAEHEEDWPFGRFNHYLFDMNRDWFAQTQIETRGRLAAILKWHPQVFVDLHEMGSNSTYYFAPPAEPYNPEITQAQAGWLKSFGRNNARWFDRYGFDYFTREIFDSFYPGYGEGWPLFHGAIGMTYEQASVRGLVVDRDDETKLHYRDSVQHHFISSISTAETAAARRKELLEYFYDYRRTAIAEGASGPIKEFVIVPGRDPNRAARLASKLMSQGIEVKRASASFRNPDVTGYYQDGSRARQFPAGAYLISLQQPTKRLIQTLFQKHVSMGEEFVGEQQRRQAKRLGLEIYDVTAWSVPLLYDVEAYWTGTPSQGDFEVLQGEVGPTGRVKGGRASLAYLIQWGRNAAAGALASLLRQDVRVHTTDKAFTIDLSGGAIEFPAGSLIVKIKDNPSDLHERLERVASESGIEIFATDTSWVSKGVNFGSGNVRYVKKPRVALAYHSPTSPTSVGAARYLLEREYGYPVTVVKTNRLGRGRLDDYDVLILPEVRGSYTRRLGEAGVTKIRDWVRAGGTLIALGSATKWLTEEKVGLLDTKAELRGGKLPSKEDKKDKKEKSPEGQGEGEPGEAGLDPEEEPPFRVNGAIMRVDLDPDHWLAFGYGERSNVLVGSNRIFRALKLDKGTNVVRYAPREEVLLSGFAFDETIDQIAGKAYLMHSRLGSGHVIAFAEDPNFRAFCDGLNLLFLNAVFLGPAH